MAHEGANKTEQEPLLRTPNLEGFGALQEPSDLTEVYHTGREKGEAWFKLVGSEKGLFVIVLKAVRRTPSKVGRLDA